MAHSGSHLTVTTRASKIIIKGKMAHAKPRGCHLSADRMRAVCPLAGAAAIELDMGPAGDFVEIADPLPFPVIAHLGMGSDKLFGRLAPQPLHRPGRQRRLHHRAEEQRLRWWSWQRLLQDRCRQRRLLGRPG